MRHPKKCPEQNGKDRAARAVADTLLRGEKVAAIPLKSDTTRFVRKPPIAFCCCFSRQYSSVVLFLHFSKTEKDIQWLFDKIDLYYLLAKLQMEKGTSWWFQPIWKIVVKLDHFPRVEGENIV